MNNIDYLQRTIEAYKSGKITEEYVKKYLSFQTYQEDRKYYRTCKWCLKLFDWDIAAVSAEDEYVEEWRQKSIKEIIGELLYKEIITQEQFRILWQWCVDMRTQAEIAEELGVSQQAVAKRIHGIQVRAAKYIDYSLVSRLTTNAPMNCRRNAEHPKIKVKWPFEFAMRINNGIKKKSNGEYKILSRCVLPEMLQQCFGDSKTRCGYCYDNFGENSCTRKEVN